MKLIKNMILEKKISKAILCSLLFLSPFNLSAKEKFGYLSYSTTNIGDDIQALAAKQFLPRDAVGIDRDLLSTFKSNQKVNTVMNGWFMHTSDGSWKTPLLTYPKKPWPPSRSVKPFFISFHINRGFLNWVLTPESKKYLRDNGPIGARDVATMKKLNSEGIPSYYSGCLTLTLKKKYFGPRDKVVYAVDIPKDCVEYLRKNTKFKVIEFSHGVPAEIFYKHNNAERLAYASRVLRMYEKCQYVVTQRLHAAMPCLALKTPVIFLTNKGDGRVASLADLTHHCSRASFLKGEFDFNLNNPPENPKDYLVLRKKLNETMSEWVKKNS